MVEHRQTMSKVLQEEGCKVNYYQHIALATTLADKETAAIRNKEYAMVFCEFPIAKWHVPRDKFARVMTVLSVWAAAAAASSTPFLLCGLAGSK